jgi:hypothetical protein
MTPNKGPRGTWCIVCTTADGRVLAINEYSHKDALRGYTSVAVHEKAPQEAINMINAYLRAPKGINN